MAPNRKVDSMLLERKTALITAGASGIGLASARAFAAQGAHVILVDVNAEAVRAAADALADEGLSAEWYAADLRDHGQLRELAAQVTAEHDSLDVLFNNVGVPGAGGIDLTPEQWDDDIAINARASFFLTGLLADALRRAEAASVIFTSSTSGLVASPTSPLYAFAKGGIIALARSLAVAWASDGIRVNAIAPGSTATPALPSFFRTDDEQEIARRMEAFTAQIPMGRTCRPEEIAQAALFLASAMSSYVTGITLPVDGGFTAR
jgi:NAD(P)-dependent dehydrogenase (short-subunit alcohol dehydrogenase family)